MSTLNRCQDKRCQNNNFQVQCWLHNAEMYYPELPISERHNGWGYWACDVCVSADHKEWLKQNNKRLTKDSSPLL